MSNRRGISLVELLVVMSGCTIILSMSAALLHRSMQTQSETRHFFDVERAALRLSDQFRRDVHAADSATVQPESAGEERGALVRLALDDNRIVEYRRHEATVVRALLDDGRPTAREEFRLHGAMEVSVEQLQSPRRIALSITTDPASTYPDIERRPAGIRELPVNLRVEAVPGRDGRFAEAANSEEATP